VGEKKDLINTPLTPPAILSSEHSLNDFDCGNPTLNKWLKRYAMLNQQSNSARTFVVCKEKSVIGFYTLAVGSIEHETAGKRIKKGLAGHPIPVMILARLAVDLKFQGQSIGSGLLKEKDEKARRFYERFDFEPSPIDPMKLMLLIKDARKTVAGL